ncbi:protein of unknown function [Maridesulfovibrio hydrothermalis AM13 = DSM 14728]|uniref:Uncharacterized protein n=1 Tax=Maridesulfovibrio hydrothermalis AM13 = DSM 14728 TaxID=1121451 RepID=L0R6U8_9BACT|nr:protein of unknown function [Maridesulfovibrio hydrothermalis AM13 = DSM 14728]
MFLRSAFVNSLNKSKLRWSIQLNIAQGRPVHDSECEDFKLVINLLKKMISVLL